LYVFYGHLSALNKTGLVLTTKLHAEVGIPLYIYSRLFYLSREIHTRQCYCAPFRVVTVSLVAKHRRKGKLNNNDRIMPEVAPIRKTILNDARRKTQHAVRTGTANDDSQTKPTRGQSS